MNLRATLDSGKTLQARSENAPTNNALSPQDLAARLDKGLRWLVAHYEFATTEEQQKWVTAQAQWLALAMEHDERLGLPPGYTKDELDLALAWLRGDRESPQVYFTPDTEDLRGGNVTLAPAGGFSLPRKLVLADGAGLKCLLKKRPTDGPRVYDILDLVRLFRLKRIFPAAGVVGDPVEFLRQHDDG
jgi:hypothetical protein